jgi:hypothetical protein
VRLDAVEQTEAAGDIEPDAYAYKRVYGQELKDYVGVVGFQWITGWPSEKVSLPLILRRTLKPWCDGRAVRRDC